MTKGNDEIRPTKFCRKVRNTRKDTDCERGCVFDSRSCSCLFLSLYQLRVSVGEETNLKYFKLNKTKQKSISLEQTTNFMRFGDSWISLELQSHSLWIWRADCDSSSCVLTYLNLPLPNKLPGPGLSVGMHRGVGGGEGGSAWRGEVQLRPLQAARCNLSLSLLQAVQTVWSCCSRSSDGKIGPIYPFYTF